MKTRAAVASEKAKPLEFVEVDLEGPREGEVLVEIKATGICHTDEFTILGADPEGLFPAIMGHEGAGVVVDVGPGVKSVRKGDHVIPLYTPECRNATTASPTPCRREDQRRLRSHASGQVDKERRHLPGREPINPQGGARQSPLCPDSGQIPQRSEMTRWAMCGRLRAVKALLHVAALVVAAMCSAFERGSQGRWP